MSNIDSIKDLQVSLRAHSRALNAPGVRDNTALFARLSAEHERLFRALAEARAEQILREKDRAEYRATRAELLRRVRAA